METAELTMPVLPAIETKRLLLRRIDAEAAKHILAAGDHPGAREILGISDDRHMDKIVTLYSNGHNPYRSFMLFMIHDRLSGVFAGSCNFHTWMVEHSRAEIGYVIEEEFRGRGIAKEAIQCIIRYGFEHMGLNRVEAFVGPFNQPSQKLMAHFGFTKEGVLRQHYCKNGAIEDSECFSLLRAEYQELKNTGKSPF